ncbi:hypothetical protein O1L60_34625 [Streptomyces diastatochromogenes]|nr:hypothetical protein [Streptomyces diastatochromogenes]
MAPGRGVRRVRRHPAEVLGHGRGTPLGLPHHGRGRRLHRPRRHPRPLPVLRTRPLPLVPQTGTHIVHDAIYDAFHAAGHETQLGYPTTDEIAETGGVKQVFQKATIHWSASRGTWITTN